jgi:hypothetical protein
MDIFSVKLCVVFNSVPDSYRDSVVKLYFDRDSFVTLTMTGNRNNVNPLKAVK